MMHELIDAFDHTDADDDVRAVIVTGRGRGFCAGADLSGGGDTFAAAAVASQAGPESVPRDGGGLVIAADLRVASSRSSPPSTVRPSASASR